ncbi:MAG: hypothetical protein LBS83_00885 [Holosporales bacterium]|jgi:hypothetical protein|nr:hypothetical protein [Holosporales bacterium]
MINSLNGRRNYGINFTQERTTHQFVLKSSIVKKAYTNGCETQYEFSSDSARLEGDESEDSTANGYIKI